jgi:transposase
VPTTALRRHSPAAPAPASLACFLATNGQRVLEVNRPDRQLRRRHGKSDPVDADAAARTVQAGEATGIPKAADGAAEMVRALRAARQTAVKAPTQAINALKGCWSPRLPSSVSSSRACPAPKLVAAAAVLEPGTLVTPTAATMLALGSLAGRYQHLDAEIKALTGTLDQLTAKTAPALRACMGRVPTAPRRC